MDRQRQTLKDAYRTPSPEKLPTDGSRKHSPWTAPRARKKGKSSPEARLPNLEESSLERASTLDGEGTESFPSCAARDMALHLAQNPFLEHTGLATLLAQHPDSVISAFQPAQRILALHATQEKPIGQNPAAILDAVGREPELCLAALQSAALLLPTQEWETCKALREDAAMQLCESQNIAHGGQCIPARNPSSGSDVPVGLAEGAEHDIGEIMHDQKIVDCTAHRPNGHCLLSPSKICQLASASQSSPPQLCFVSDTERGTLRLQRTPRLNGLPPSVAATPSPDVPAPGIRHDLHGRVPPRVPTSSRTIRRVLVDSPPQSACIRSACRGLRQMETCSAEGQGRDDNLRLDCTNEFSMCPMSVEKFPLQPKQSSFQLNCDAMDRLNGQDVCNCKGSKAECSGCSDLATQHTTQGISNDAGQLETNAAKQDLSKQSSPEYVLARVHVTPHALLSGWDDEERGPMGPLKGPGGDSVRHSGELSTFDERLHEAVQNGDAVTLGQAWQDVRGGALRPDDIDTLNTLLKCYCKVEGDPEEAEEVVKVACRDGRLQPNSSTYHHMAALWTRHEQLNHVG